eukprot:TRINITY_DN22966_c0_g1_i1.p2 TRINITY_DN22966_c0_g1~~TRINITY_DN22966_c0_g1_i1.p2  ORF type:complete len:170 (+),score=72.99 TRINITY_DN22966_c0_g1_i1:88-597(+)
MAGADERKVILVSADEKKLPVSRAACQMSGLLKDLLEEQPDEGGETVEIPVTNVNAHVLEKIIEYMTEHHNNRAPELERPLKQNLFEILQPWDAKFIQPHNEQFVFELIMGANFLNVRDLLELACARVAEWVKEKSVEEIREMFGLENDFTPEEEERLRKEHGIDKFGF